MICQVIESIRHELPQQTHLVAVSKYHPCEAIQAAYDCGQRIFGESHVQELMAKHDALPKDIEWHFIGHLQTNKVKYIAPFISLIHAVDTPKLLNEISKQGIKNGRRIPCLLELHVAQEESKFGFSLEACEAYLESGEWKTLEGVQICGMMCMASNTDNEEQIVREFRMANSFFSLCKEKYFPHDDNFCHRSWGMSDDYPLAVQNGSTLVRIGTKIFGERSY